MKRCRVTPIAASLLLCCLAFGQDADWERLITAGDTAMSKRQYSEAENSYREALKFAEQHWKKDARISGALLKLAQSCNAQSKKEDAETIANRAVVTMDEALKAHKPKNASDELEEVEVSAALFDKVGDIFAANQKYSDAEGMYRRVISVREKYATEKFPAKARNEDFFRSMSQVLGNAPGKVADANDKLADLYRGERKIEEAMVLYRQSEDLREKQYGADKPQTAKSLNDLAICYSLQGNYDKAEPLFQRAIDIFDRSDYRDTPQMATTLENYALLLKRSAREADAKDLLDRANSIRAKSGVVPQ
jgi:tetratricopeptide (TPR) repeat protein